MVLFFKDKGSLPIFYSKSRQAFSVKGLLVNMLSLWTTWPVTATQLRHGRTKAAIHTKEMKGHLLLRKKHLSSALLDSVIEGLWIKLIKKTDQERKKFFIHVHTWEFTEKHNSRKWLELEAYIPFNRGRGRGERALMRRQIFQKVQWVLWNRWLSMIVLWQCLISVMSQYPLVVKFLGRRCMTTEFFWDALLLGW